MGIASWQRYCTASSSGCQPNFAALNRGCHLCSAGRPSRGALAHILVSSSFFSSSPILSGCRLDVYHTSTHVAIVRIQNAGMKCAASGSLKIQDAQICHLRPIAQLCRAISWAWKWISRNKIKNKMTWVHVRDYNWEFTHSHCNLLLVLC